jgi:phosphoglycolate phosphatase
MPAAVLFDLDGTLTDSAPGIISSIEHGLGLSGIASPGADVLRSFVGPPLRRSLVSGLGLDLDTADLVVTRYREHFAAEGMYDNALFPEIAALLDELSAEGRYLVVATAKPTAFARKILEHFDVAARFSAICGAQMSERDTDKASIVADALAALPPQVVRDAVMVGDREMDVLAARANGLDCIGVEWGYAAPGELQRAGAALVVGTIDELRAALA